jgi:hypothetical protein
VVEKFKAYATFYRFSAALKIGVKQTCHREKIRFWMKPNRIK